MRRFSLPSTRRSSAARRARARGAFSLLELTVVLAILSVAVMLFLQTMMASSRMDPVSEETRVASEAARVRLEEMRALPYDVIFRSYNEDPADDPLGPGTAPGAWFAVPGLELPASATAVGWVDFPGTGAMLSENVTDAQLGMPRDLDADGVVDGDDHASDAILLPVRVRLEWASKTGRHGKRQLSLHHMFMKL